MNSSVNITVLIYFNGSIVTIVDEGIKFMCDCPAYLLLSQTMSFEEINAEFYQSIHVGTQKRVEKIIFRCPILIINRNIKYQAQYELGLARATVTSSKSTFNSVKRILASNCIYVPNIIYISLSLLCICSLRLTFFSLI